MRLGTGQLLTIIIGLTLIAFCPEHGHACGPDFPNMMLIGDDDTLFWAPRTDHELELERMRELLNGDTEFQFIKADIQVSQETINDGIRQTTSAYESDLMAALVEYGYDDSTYDNILDDSMTLRGSMEVYARFYRSHHGQYANSHFSDRYDNIWTNSDDERFWSGYQPSNFERLESLVIPEDMPEEFNLYLCGASNYYQGQWAAARSDWEALMRLPSYDRKYRSTWASYMIARTLLDDDPSKAIYWCQMTRNLARDGYHDSIGLAAASYNLEAAANINLGNYAEGLESYYYAANSGDDSALRMIRWTCLDLFDTEASNINDAALNPIARDLVTVSVSTNFGLATFYDRSYRLLTWLDVLETTGITDVKDADLLAWNAYRMGEYDQARRWLDLSRETGYKAWLEAKFALRNGDLRNAEEFLEQAKTILNQMGSEIETESADEMLNPPLMRINGELGVLQLGEGNYNRAINSFLEGEYWSDAAYIMEQVLNVNELKEFVDEFYPQPGRPAGRFTDNHPGNSNPDVLAYNIRWLLARRLARLDQWDKAIEYYPDQYREYAERYMAFIEIGENASFSSDVRADNLWDAAMVCREWGMQILGSELEPDWSIYGGYYSSKSFSNWRLGTPSWGSPRSDHFLASQDEIDRITRHQNETNPNRRFHYRWLASDIAWRACELMSDNDDLMVYRLCTAGGWIKFRDPDGADRFFKAMVNRGRSTILGMEADERNWFPDCETVYCF